MRKGKNMQKKAHDYDNVFKTMKSRHKRLFISVINDIFDKNYSLDVRVDALPTEGYLIESETVDGSREIEERISDFLIKVESEVYLLECQSYDDGSMAIRIAEYAFIVARQFAAWDMGCAKIPMPRFSVIYVKRTDKTPETTTITFTFPDGQSVVYESDNVILDQLSKDITSGNNVNKVVEDLIYFRDEMLRLNKEGELSDAELIDLMGFVNTIITHITNGNRNEERLVKVMGGTIIETESEKWIRQGIQQGMQQGQAKMIIELGLEDGLDESAILKRMQEKIGFSMEEALACMKRYGKQSME